MCPILACSCLTPWSLPAAIAALASTMCITSCQLLPVLMPCVGGVDILLSLCVTLGLAYMVLAAPLLLVLGPLILVLRILLLVQGLVVLVLVRRFFP
jgi:hypothetical protein